jgi:hypothetical protein
MPIDVVRAMKIARFRRVGRIAATSSCARRSSLSALTVCVMGRKAAAHRNGAGSTSTRKRTPPRK